VSREVGEQNFNRDSSMQRKVLGDVDLCGLTHAKQLVNAVATSERVVG
jgi:hypothetical protein